MTQVTRGARTPLRLLATTALVFAGAVGASGCSSVPDAVNPVEWYRGASEAVGGMFGGDEPEPSKTAGDPGTSPDTSYPNLSTVPPRPTPSTTAEQREALKQGLVADRANARYTEPAPGAPAPAPKRSQPQSSPAPQSAPEPAPRPQSSAPRPAPEQQAALPAPATAAATAPTPVTPASVTPASVTSAPATPAPVRPVATPAAAAPAVAKARAGSGSGLWPSRPAPETPGVQASTTGRVGGDEIHRRAATGGGTPSSQAASVATATASRPAPPAAPDTRLAERTTLDSAGPGTGMPMGRQQPQSASPPRAQPAAASAMPPQPVSSQPPRPEPVPAQPRASEQSVIVNEDAIGPAPGPAAPAIAPGGRRYLAATIYFGHGSASITAAERQEIVRIAKASAANGAAIQVIGHASGRTAELSMRDHETVNLAMSMRRARAVADALVQAGMPSERVIVEARSDEQPEFYEVMPSGEAGNRRAEIVVIY